MWVLSIFKLVLFRFEMLKSYHQVLNADTEGTSDNYSDVDDEDDIIIGWHVYSELFLGGKPSSGTLLVCQLEHR